MTYRNVSLQFQRFNLTQAGTPHYSLSSWHDTGIIFSHNGHGEPSLAGLSPPTRRLHTGTGIIISYPRRSQQAPSSTGTQNSWLVEAVMCFGRSKNVSCIERNTSQPVSNLRGYTNSSAHPSSPPASEHQKWCHWNMIRTSADLVRCLNFSFACIDLTENPYFSNISLSICLQTY